MNAARALIIGVVLVGLAACGGSDTVDDRYYSLVLAAGPANDASDDGTVDLIVGPIELPRYLAGRGLSMQVGPNRIETANHHFWAEPLDEAIAKVLVRDIDARTDGLVVQRESGRWTAEADCRIRVEFDAFHPTHQSRTAVSGRFWILHGDDARQTDFSLAGRLTDDGYAHAVDVLRDNVNALAGEIVRALEDEAGCGD